MLFVLGLGFDYFFDVCEDVKDVVIGELGGILCIIEGLLYVEGVFISEGEVRMDDG